MKRIQSIALLLALTCLLTEVSAGRGQIIGKMNEVDDDNNIVGDVPFYNVDIPHKKAPLIQKVAFFLKCVLMLVIVIGLVAGCYFCYKKYNDRVRRVKMPKLEMGKKNKKQNSMPSNFSIFTDEEKASQS